MKKVERTVSSNTITAAVFAAYVKCPTKAFLLARGERPFDTFFAQIGRSISMAYKAKIRNISSVKFDHLESHSDPEITATFVDSETAFYDRVTTQRDHRTKTAERRAANYVPVLYSAWDKTEHSDALIVSFCALAIEQATGTEIPTYGKIILGDAARVKTVRVVDFLARTHQAINRNCLFNSPQFQPSYETG